MIRPNVLKINRGGSAAPLNHRAAHYRGQKKREKKMKKATKALYAQFLEEEIKENEEMQHDGEIGHAIYIMGGLIVGGGFCGGIRGNDHHCLLMKDYRDNSQFITVKGERYAITWEDVLSWGTVIVPEMESYISNTRVADLEAIGFTRLPLGENHLTGY